jgi:RNA polymerase sigma factor (sigma-70 family)
VLDNLDQLFRLYHRELQQIAYRRLGDRELAADLTQDAFLRYVGLERQQRTQAIENPRFFLIRVLSNLVFDVGRSRMRRGPESSLDDIQNELYDPRPGPAAMVELNQQLLLLQQALEELSENSRRALLLNRIDGLGHVAIAAQLGVSPSMVSKYIMSALLHCARRLGMTK